MRVSIAALLTAACSVSPDTRPEPARGADPHSGDPRVAALDRLADASLARGRAYERLRSLCETAPHRLSGSAGEARAIEWARATMEADGFENVRLEPVTVPHWVRGEVEELVVTAPPELAGERLPILALGGSVATPTEGVEAAVIVVRSFEELARRAPEAEGKIVLFDRPMDDTLLDTFKAYGGAVEQRVNGASEAAEVGAVAALVRSLSTGRDDNPHTGAMRYADGVPRIPAAAVTTNAADRIAREVGDGTPVRLRLRLDCETLPDVESYNVVGELVGRELPDEIVLVGGHLDAWDVGQGAHDCAAGCVQAMEAVRLLRELDLRPRRTIRCVLFANEENGLAGGRTYRADHADELDRHVLAIESDRGAFTPRGFTASVTDEAFLVLEELVPLLARTGAEKVVRGGGGPDIRPMGEAGVPLAGYLPDPQRYFDFHHSPADVIDAVHPRELQLGATAIAGLAWLVADREEPLPRADAPRSTTGPLPTRRSLARSFARDGIRSRGPSTARSEISAEVEPTR